MECERTKDLFKKFGDIKETFHARLGTVKGRSSKDLYNRSRKD